MVVHGHDQDWGMDVTFRGETYFVDKQLGEIQAFAPEGSVPSSNHSDFAAEVSRVPSSLGTALLKLCFA